MTIKELIEAGIDAFNQDGVMPKSVVLTKEDFSDFSKDIQQDFTGVIVVMQKGAESNISYKGVMVSGDDKIKNSHFVINATAKPLKFNLTIFER